MPVPVSTSRSKEKPALSNSAAYSSRVRCFPPIRTNMLMSITLTTFLYNDFGFRLARSLYAPRL